MILYFPATKRERDIMLMRRELRKEHREQTINNRILIIQFKQQLKEAMK